MHVTIHSIVNATSFGATDVNTDQLMNEIREANLSYLMLAQNMVRQDRDAAVYRLGVSEDVANVLTYVYSQWHNNASVVTPEDVAKVRAEK